VTSDYDELAKEVKSPKYLESLTIPSMVKIPDAFQFNWTIKESI